MSSLTQVNGSKLHQALELGLRPDGVANALADEEA
jgi:hypothetical protein